MTTTQEKEFNEQIDRIGELYEGIKDNIRAIEFGYATIQDKTDVYVQLMELRDIACMKVKNIHQPNSN